MSKRLNLEGQRFGRLTVIEKAEDYISPKGHHNTQWLCQCDCGNKTVVTTNRLRSGETKSCGCYLKEKRQLTWYQNKPNEFDIINYKYGIGYTNKGEPFYFDKEDYDLIKKYTWYIGKNGYVSSTTEKHSRITYLHRLVMNAPYGKYIDHINHNPLDNRKENLRIVTNGQNLMNASIRKNNTSGIRGVNKQNNKWRARIQIDGNCIELGNFYNKEDAIKARKDAEEKYFGEYAYKL